MPLAVAAGTVPPSVRLRPIGDPQLPPTSVLEAIPGRENVGLTTVDAPATARPPSTLPPSPVRPGHDDIGEVLAARGEVPTSSSSQATGGASAIDLTARVLTRPSELARWQQDDTNLDQVRKVLSNGVDSSQGRSGCDRYGLGTHDVVWYDGGKGRKLPAIPVAKVADIIAFVHTLHGHAGVGATLSLLRDHFHWLTMMKDTRHYVLSCACRRRKRPLSRRVAMMPGRPLEPWDELQLDILKIDTPS